MNLPPRTVALLLVGVVVYLGALYGIDRSLKGTAKAMFRWVAGIGTIAGFFYGLGEEVSDYAMAVKFAKAGIAILAAAFVFYEAHRAGQKRPISERWKRFVGVCLAVAALVSYNSGFRYGYPGYWHRHDQFHYYMGAKYFREMGYDGLYRCTAIAEDEIGRTTAKDDNGKLVTHDLRAEVRAPDKTIRNLGGDNNLMPVTDVLAHPEMCKSLFTPERWNEFKDDVTTFRFVSDKGYWDGMQKDHGFNPPPVWTIMGWLFSNAHPASVAYNRFLSFLDVGYELGMFALLWWAFGWRVSCVGAIFWATQGAALPLWTEGAFLRQDWLFWLVGAACFARKRWFYAAGAAAVYSALLRVFPGLAIIGWLVVAGCYLVKHKRLSVPQLRTLIGGTVAACVLIPASIYVSTGHLDKQAFKDSYGSFFVHTLEVHDRTPLTNHMGMRVLISHDIPAAIYDLFTHRGTGASGRMKFTQDNHLTDPFDVWKRMRNERYDKYKWVGWIFTAATLGFFIYIGRKMKSLWLALCLGQVFIILLSQLTCYYYSFMILAAPLTKVKRGIEPWFFGISAILMFLDLTVYFYDDRYTAMTLVCLVWCWALLAWFAPKELGDKVRALFGKRQDEAEPEAEAEKA